MNEQKNTLKGAVREWLDRKVEDFKFWKEIITIDDVLLFINLICATTSVICWLLHFVLKNFEWQWTF